jgi:hypothetical protein
MTGISTPQQFRRPAFRLAPQEYALTKQTLTVTSYFFHNALLK